MYGTGFPKGQGCLKPAWEPILLARKPGPRVLPLGIDACRVPTTDDTSRTQNAGPTWSGEFQGGRRVNGGSEAGRYPANVLHDGSDEVLEAFAAFGDRASGGKRGGESRTDKVPSGYMGEKRREAEHSTFGDTGTAARFFYCAKSSKSERGEGNTHPTVKPLALMRWMVRLVTPEGGRVLDPFAGSGSTLVAATLEGFDSVGVELDAGHCEIIKRRLAAHADTGLFAEVA
jgi:site-specific DNA-methyltransferase (adenine-specific)